MKVLATALFVIAPITLLFSLQISTAHADELLDNVSFNGSVQLNGYAPYTYSAAFQASSFPVDQTFNLISTNSLASETASFQFTESSSAVDLNLSASYLMSSTCFTCGAATPDLCDFTTTTPLLLTVSMYDRYDDSGYYGTTDVYFSLFNNVGQPIWNPQSSATYGTSTAGSYELAGDTTYAMTEGFGSDEAQAALQPETGSALLEVEFTPVPEPASAYAFFAAVAYFGLSRKEPVRMGR